MLDKIIKTFIYYYKLLAYIAWRRWNLIKSYLFPTNVKPFLDMFSYSPRHPQPKYEKEAEMVCTVKREKLPIEPVSKDISYVPVGQSQVSSTDRWSINIKDIESTYAPGAIIPLPDHIVAWEFGDRGNPTVLLIHGFAGRGLQMAGFAKPLVEKGFHVLTCDFPGCGLSPGKRTAPLVFVGALGRILRQPLPGATEPPKIVSIIAHSMGVLATTASTILYRRALYQDDGVDLYPDLKSLVLVAGSESVEHVIDNFSKAVGVSQKAIPNLLAGMSRPKMSWKTLDNGQLLLEMSDPRWNLSIPQILIVHDDSDKEVFVKEGRILKKKTDAVVLDKPESLNNCMQEAKKRVLPVIYWETHGLGHKRILKDETVTGTVADFIQLTC